MLNTARVVACSPAHAGRHPLALDGQPAPPESAAGNPTLQYRELASGILPTPTPWRASACCSCARASGRTRKCCTRRSSNGAHAAAGERAALTSADPPASPARERLRRAVVDQQVRPYGERAQGYVLGMGPRRGTHRRDPEPGSGDRPQRRLSRPPTASPASAGSWNDDNWDGDVGRARAVPGSDRRRALTPLTSFESRPHPTLPRVAGEGWEGAESS